MVDIAAIGRSHLARQLSGKMKRATVDQWIDEDGNKVEIFWKPLTGKEQKRIDEFTTNVDRICAMVKIRCRDSVGKLIFADHSMASLENDYDFEVLQAIAFLMISDMGQERIEDKIGTFAKE